MYCPTYLIKMNYEELDKRNVHRLLITRVLYVVKSEPTKELVPFIKSKEK
jgi:hypothetical protein